MPHQCKVVQGNVVQATEGFTPIVVLCVGWTLFIFRIFVGLLIGGVFDLHDEHCEPWLLAITRTKNHFWAFVEVSRNKHLQESYKQEAHTLRKAVAKEEVKLMATEGVKAALKHTMGALTTGAMSFFTPYIFSAY